jgi:hypothetical protein
MIHITRNLYYYTKQNTLRYSEDSPVKEHCDHQICNCTKAVTERPAGEPDQKQQYIEFLDEDKNYKYEVGLAGTGCHFTLRWPGEVWDKDHKWCSKNHAYYWFNSNGMIQIEIIKEGYGGTNCFFAHVFRGNRVDTSKFFNGHANSRIVDLSKLKSDELWAHYCGMAQEAQCSFRECDETQEWLKVYEIQEEIAETARTFDQDFASSVEKVRAVVEGSVQMIADVKHLCRWFRIVTKNLAQTEMFRCGDYCYKNSWEKYK